ncbi:hypothetical protein TURU_128002 [Turdus rufiventris]|nr:hypothetical protein TURU_128002 [Turdus rufiventris]
MAAEWRWGQDEQSQPFLIEDVFQSCSWLFCGPAPGSPYLLIVLEAPELDAYSSLGDGWPMGYECTVPVHVQFFTYQNPQVLLNRAALDLSIPPPVTIPGVALAHVQHLALGFVEPHEILELDQAPLDSIPSFRSANSTTHLGVICKFVEALLDWRIY